MTQHARRSSHHWQVKRQFNWCNPPNLRHYKRPLWCYITHAHLRRSRFAAVKESNIAMTTDHTRRGLLKVATLAGVSALLLPGTALLPAAKAQATAATEAMKASKASTSGVMVNGWLLKASDR